ncbi:MAG: hypothetical protein Phog2KO_20090 [Phototrophicaceae bacterium]
MATTTDTRTMKIVDLPLIRRLTANGTVLDSERGLTRDARGANSFLLSSLVFPRGVYTLVSRSENQQIVGQFRYRPDDLNAHIVYIASSINDDVEDTVWLNILDAMTREAGKHGAHSLIAEVETSSHLFETLRTARFSTYARQIIWRHAPIDLDKDECELTLETDIESDSISVMSLINNTVPTILQQVATPPSDMRGLAYRKDGRIEAYIAISEGANGVYLLPFIHPDVMSQAADIIRATVAQIDRCAKVPIYVCVRSYQDWLNSIFEELDFEEWVEQAVMVKQIAVGIKHPGFAKIALRGKLKVTSNIPNYWSIAIEHSTSKPLS